MVSSESMKGPRVPRCQTFGEASKDYLCGTEVHPMSPGSSPSRQDLVLDPGEWTWVRVSSLGPGSDPTDTGRRGLVFVNTTSPSLATAVKQ